MKLVLNDIQGEMKPVRRGFGKQYLVEYENGVREFVDSEKITYKLKNFEDNKYGKTKKKKSSKKTRKNKKNNKE